MKRAHTKKKLVFLTLKCYFPAYIFICSLIMSKPTGIANIITALFAVLACTAFSFTIFGTNWVHYTEALSRHEQTYEQEGLWKKCVEPSSNYFNGNSGSSQKCVKLYPSMPMTDRSVTCSPSI